MDYEPIFRIANLYPMPFWLLMILAPTWPTTKRIISSLWIFVPLAVAYSALLIFAVAGGNAATGNAMNNVDLASLVSAAGIANLLGTVPGATVGWIHFLAFDLFVGRWMYLDSRKCGITPWIMWLPILFTLLAGPMGWLIYMLIRAVTDRRDKRKPA
jgi:hypothetical protein